MNTVLEEEWEKEREKFEWSTKVVLSYLQEFGQIPIIEHLFLSVYKDVERRLLKNRGWWNPLLSPYSVYHFYDHAIMILSPVSSESEFEREHGIDSKSVLKLINNDMLTVFLSSPHTEYSCGCFEDMLNAQGALPTIPRFMETLKAVRIYLIENLLEGRAEDAWVYDTEALHNALRDSLRLDDERARDVATRLSDLAVMGYTNLSRRLFLELQRRNDKDKAISLVRAFHHVLVEPT